MPKSKPMTNFVCCYNTKIKTIFIIPKEKINFVLNLIIETYLSVHGSSASKRIIPDGGKYAYAKVPPGPSNRRISS